MLVIKNWKQLGGEICEAYAEVTQKRRKSIFHFVRTALWLTLIPGDFSVNFIGCCEASSPASFIFDSSSDSRLV